MNDFRVSEKVADYLLGTLFFRLHSFSIAFDVPARYISRNGILLGSTKYAPLLVCDENRILCGIARSYDDAPCYNRDMQGLPYAQLFDVPPSLPMCCEDDSFLEYIPAQALENLLASLERILVPQALGENQNAVYSIQTLPAAQEYPVDTLRNQYLVDDQGCPTDYGNTHGLFLSRSSAPDGSRSSLLQVPCDATKTLRCVLAPYPKKKAKRSLTHRRQQLPTQPASIANVPAALKKLLQAPVDKLLRGKPEALSTLAKVLPTCQVLLNEEPMSDTAVTYGQLLRLLHQLRRGFGTDPKLDDWQSCRMRRASESLLSVVAEIFMPHDASARPTGAAGRQSLRHRLADLSEDTLEQLANTPLYAYFAAVSTLADSRYPNWVYDTRVRPLLESADKPESAYTLRFWAAYCRLCLEDNGAHDWQEAFPLLYCLTMPECFAANPF